MTDDELRAAVEAMSSTKRLALLYVLIDQVPDDVEAVLRSRAL